MGYFKALNYWVLGGFDGQCSPGDAISAVKSFGLDGIEFTFPDSIKEDITRDECAAILKTAKDAGIELRTLASGAYWGTSLSSEDKSERTRAIEFTERYIEAASWLGVDRILVVPGAVDVGWDPSKPVVSYRKVWENSTDSIRSILPVAQKHGVTLCFENVWNKFLLGPFEMRDFIDQFKSQYVGSYFDVGNVAITGYAEHWIEILEGRIKAVHFKNFSRNDAAGGLHGFGEDLLQGDVNFDGILGALASIRYDGPVTAEMIPFSRLPELNIPDMELARKTAAAMRKILG